MITQVNVNEKTLEYLRYTVSLRPPQVNYASNAFSCLGIKKYMDKFEATNITSNLFFRETATYALCLVFPPGLNYKTLVLPVWPADGNSCTPKYYAHILKTYSISVYFYTCAFVLAGFRPRNLFTCKRHFPNYVFIWFRITSNPNVHVSAVYYHDYPLFQIKAF